LEGEKSDEKDGLIKKIAMPAYQAARRSDAERFPNTFMDVENTRNSLIEEVHKKVFDKQVKSLGVAAALIALGLTIIIFGLNKFSEQVVLSRISDISFANEKLLELTDRLDALEDANSKLNVD
jgi:hypothetical protein